MMLPCKSADNKCVYAKHNANIVLKDKALDPVPLVMFIEEPQGPLHVPRLQANPSLETYPNARVALAPAVYLSLIIPTYNERPTLTPLIRLISQVLDQHLPNHYELIVVDDDSSDRTWQLAEELSHAYSPLRVMRRQQEQGLSTAVIRGWQVARGEVLGVIDGDLQHPPEILAKLLKAMAQGSDLAVASRHIDGGGVSDWNLTRRILSRGAQILGLIMLPGVIGRVSDPMSGYFLVRRAAIAETLLNPTGYKILIEVLGRGKIEQITEVGYVFQERHSGTSKVTLRQYSQYLIHLLRLRMRRRSGQNRRAPRLNASAIPPEISPEEARHTLPLQGWTQVSSKRFNPLTPFPLKHFLQFCIVGFSGVLIDMAVLYLLSDSATLAWGLTRSKIIAAEIAILNNFLWNDRWTFGEIARQQQGRLKQLKRFGKFNLICLLGLLLNVLILNLLFNGVGLNRYLANLIAIAVVTFWNFWINLRLSWRVTAIK